MRAFGIGMVSARASSAFTAETMALKSAMRAGALPSINSKLMVDASGSPLGIHAIARDVTDRKEIEARQTVLMRELQHRTKNMLAVIQSIATTTLRRSPDLESALASFVGRLHALGHAQEFVAAGPGGGVSLHHLVAAELAPFAARAKITGDQIVVGGAFAQTFALLIHELCTNATKYGALSSSRGRVVINWTIERTEVPQLRFAWVERGGPPVKVPTGSGMGTLLLSSAGEAKTAFNEEGFEYVLSVSLSEAVIGSE